MHKLMLYMLCVRIRLFMFLALIAIPFNVLLADINTANTATTDNTSSTETPATIARLPLSTLPLELIGTIVGSQVYALISVKGQKEKLFMPGENIIDGSVLAQVYPKAVVLQQGKVFTRIVLRNVNGSQQQARAIKPEPVEGKPPILSAKITQPIPEKAIKHLGNNAYVVKRQLVKAQIESQDMFTLAKMIPKAKGEYQIIEIVPESFYQKMGLKDGDTIRTVNGKPMATYMDFVDKFKEKSNTSWIEMEITRAGNPEKLQYTLQ